MNDAALSRIIVENESDWLRVQSNVEQSMTRSMEVRLSSLPGGKDGSAAKAARGEVQARLAKIRESMFEMSKPNLRVNGHNYENFVNATEPFDEILDRRVKAMDDERLKWETDVADRRKKRPVEIHQLEDDIEERSTWAMWLPEGEDEDTGPKKKAEDIPPPPRHAEVVETFNTLASNLAELASSAPAQLARAQRAKAVQEEINNMGP